MNNKLRKSVQALFEGSLWIRVRWGERKHAGVGLQSRAVELMDLEKQNTGA